MQINYSGYYILYTNQTDARDATNGYIMPNPSYASGGVTISTLVNSGRSASGRLKTSLVMNRNLSKLTMKWAYLPADEWAKILGKVRLSTTSTDYGNGFYVWIKYYDMEYGLFKTREFYPSDRTATIFTMDDELKKPKDYIDCTCNFIDTGNPTEYTTETM